MKYILFLGVLMACCGISKAETANYNVRKFGISPEQDQVQNVKSLDSLVAAVLSTGGGIIYFPAGDYRFEFGMMNDCIHVIAKDSVNITFKGDGLNSKLFMANDNPTFNWEMFAISNQVNDPKLTVFFDNLDIIGPSNPGYIKEFNQSTCAIHMSNGNVKTVVKNCKITGNFYNGIIATGLGRQWLQIDDSQIESFGAMGASMTGVGEKTFHANNTTFLRNGLLASESQSDQEFGQSITLSPQTNTKITGCSFYKNYTTAIRFVGSPELSHVKFPANEANRTKYQEFEGNFFDSTANNAIDLGFYYTKPIIRNNTFFSRGYAINCVNSCLIEGNFFGRSVLRAVSCNNVSSDIADKEITITFKNNSIKSSSAFGVDNNTLIPLKINIQSSKNEYRPVDLGMQLGNGIVGDTSIIQYHSTDDIFECTYNGMLNLDYNTQTWFDNPTVFGVRFIQCTPTASKASCMITKMHCPNNQEASQTIYNPSTEIGSRDVNITLKESLIDSINPMKIAWLMENENGVHIYARTAVCKDTLKAALSMDENININYNQYYIRGTDSIAYIALFNQLNADESFSWQRYFEGELIFIALDGFTLVGEGNINIKKSIKIKKGQRVRIKYDRGMNKWEYVAAK